MLGEFKVGEEAILRTGRRETEIVRVAAVGTKWVQIHGRRARYGKENGKEDGGSDMLQTREAHKASLAEADARRQLRDDYGIEFSPWREAPLGPVWVLEALKAHEGKEAEK